MKKFIVSPKVFEILPTYCVGIVVAKGINNHKPSPEIEKLLSQQIHQFLEKFQNADIREIENIKAYRQAFLELGINPNKNACSIEALTKRIQKTSDLPSINPIVNLGNVISLKYLLAVGAHDTDQMEADFEIRFSDPQDCFRGMGESTSESLPANELVYVSGNTVKTRRWIWRQSDDGKITDQTSSVFFPIDGFSDLNLDQILKARDELAELLRQQFACEVAIGLVGKNQNSYEF